MIRAGTNECSERAANTAIAFIKPTEGHDYRRIPAETEAGTTDFDTPLAGRSLKRLMADAIPAPRLENPADGNIGNVLEAKCPLLYIVS
jgi:hypothetical protein